MTSLNGDLARATEQLATKVDRLTASLKVAESTARDARATAKRTRYLTIGVIAFACVLAFGLAKVADVSHEIDANAVTNCQNANKTREAQTALWTFMLTASMERRQDATAADKADMQAFLTWIEQLFAQRDCSDLSKKYELPPPPTLSR
jgi:hypothetical protein